MWSTNSGSRIGNKDFSSIVASIPDDIDAVYVALGGADAVNFLSQYDQAGGTKPMIGGSITVDQTVLGSKGKTKTYLIGTPSAGPIADNWDNPKWKAFVAAYKKAYPNGFPSPSLFAHGYYVEALAMMQALDTVHGDLSDGQKAFREALASETVDTPTGMVKLDKNRNAVADIFLTEVAQGEDGNLYNKVVKVIPAVDQTLGMPEDEFLALGSVSRTNPELQVAGSAKLQMAEALRLQRTGSSHALVLEGVSRSFGALVASPASISRSMPASAAAFWAPMARARRRSSMRLPAISRPPPDASASSARM